jgi:short-subunit dehydrogenase
MSSQGPFAGQLALVTGASRGIGAATAKALSAAGAHVILVSRAAKDLEKIEQEIFDAGGSATIAPVDLAEADSIARLATAISGRWMRLISW